jgi:hypothetical protein
MWLDNQEDLVLLKSEALRIGGNFLDCKLDYTHYLLSGYYDTDKEEFGVVLEENYGLKYDKRFPHKQEMEDTFKKVATNLTKMGKCVGNIENCFLN